MIGQKGLDGLSAFVRQPPLDEGVQVVLADRTIASHLTLLKTAPERRHPIVHVDPTTAISSSLTPAVVGRLIDPFTADAAGAGGRRGDGIRPTHTFL